MRIASAFIGPVCDDEQENTDTIILEQNVLAYFQKCANIITLSRQ